MDLVGAHVQKADSTDTNWYIFPLCITHSQCKGELQVAGAYKLIPSNMQEACENRQQHFLNRVLNRMDQGTGGHAPGGSGT